MNYNEILNLPVTTDDDGLVTVGDYLQKLLQTLWVEGEGFSGKRPFGDSGWEYDLYKALVAGGAVEGVLDEYGDLDDFNKLYADSLVYNLITYVFEEAT